MPQLLASTASGDGVRDKRVEAEQIATRLDTLRQRVEILAENYDSAQIRLIQVRSRVAAAQRDVRRTDREIATRQRDLARFAVSAYAGGNDDATLDLVLKGDSSDIGARAGYASAAVGDKADLVDALRAAKSDGESTIADLRTAQKQATDAQAAVVKERKAASAAVTETQQTYDRVQGELKTLVAAEQARIAAAQRARAMAAAQAAALRAHQAAPPAAPSSTTTGLPASPQAPAPPSQSAAPPPPAPPAAAVGQGAGAAIAAARSVLGVRYTWGGASPATGFDCSGLVMWAWAHGGKSLPHSSQAMYGAARKIQLSELQPGDLVFYGSPIHHVALYIGGGQIIHAPHSGSSVEVASMYYWSDLTGAGRV